MKYIRFMIDGAADKALKALDGQTPLERAKTPTLDHMIRAGTLGRVQCIPAGTPPGTEGALIEVFGSSVREAGRAYLEAPGFGVDIAPEETAFRANFITVRDGIITSHCAGTIASDEASALLEALRQDPAIAKGMQDIGLRLMDGETFRHVWAVTGCKNPPVCEPPHEHIGESAEALMPAPWAALMRQMAHLLSAHPINAQRRERGEWEANMLWPWGGGARVSIPLFTERTGLRGGCVAGAAVAKGAARLAGMRVASDPAFTADIHTDWHKKVEAALDLLQEDDAVFLHLEAPDECAHAGEVMEKVEAIEMADAMARQILDALRARGEDVRFCAFADHYTFSDTRKHGEAPTPYAIYDTRSDTPHCKTRFTEADCAALDVIPGTELWLRLAEKI